MGATVEGCADAAAAEVGLPESSQGDSHTEDELAERSAQLGEGERVLEERVTTPLAGCADAADAGYGLVESPQDDSHAEDEVAERSTQLSEQALDERAATPLAGCADLATAEVLLAGRQDYPHADDELVETSAGRGEDEQERTLMAAGAVAGGDLNEPSSELAGAKLRTEESSTADQRAEVEGQSFDVTPNLYGPSDSNSQDSLEQQYKALDDVEVEEKSLATDAAQNFGVESVFDPTVDGSFSADAFGTKPLPNNDDDDTGHTVHAVALQAESVAAVDALPVASDDSQACVADDERFAEDRVAQNAGANSEIPSETSETTSREAFPVLSADGEALNTVQSGALPGEGLADDDLSEDKAHIEASPLD